MSIDNQILARGVSKRLQMDSCLKLSQRERHQIFLQGWGSQIKSTGHQITKQSQKHVYALCNPFMAEGSTAVVLVQIGMAVFIGGGLALLGGWAARGGAGRGARLVAAFLHILFPFPSEEFKVSFSGPLHFP